ncbi:RNA methyltransferase [soil metagenome]
MLSKAQIKYIQSLQRNKYRIQYQQYLAEGAKIVPELIQSGAKIMQLYALPEWIGANSDLMKQHYVSAEPITPEELEKISALSTPNQVLAVVAMPHSETIPSPEGISIALDAIRDPGNLGTIIRTADWFGIKRVYCSLDCVDIYNPKTVQSTMGSIVRVEVIYTDLEALLKAHTHIPVFAADMDGESLYTTALPAEGILLVGSESHGVSPTLLPYTRPITIPRFGGAESLNAAMATGIILGWWKGVACIKQ